MTAHMASIPAGEPLSVVGPNRVAASRPPNSYVARRPPASGLVAPVLGFAGTSAASPYAAGAAALLKRRYPGLRAPELQQWLVKTQSPVESG
jgi:Subtilase family